VRAIEIDDQLRVDRREVQQVRPVVRLVHGQQQPDGIARRATQVERSPRQVALQQFQHRLLRHRHHVHRDVARQPAQPRGRLVGLLQRAAGSPPAPWPGPAQPSQGPLPPSAPPARPPAPARTTPAARHGAPRDSVRRPANTSQRETARPPTRGPVPRSARCPVAPRPRAARAAPHRRSRAERRRPHVARRPRSAPAPGSRSRRGARAPRAGEARAGPAPRAAGRGAGPARRADRAPAGHRHR